MRAQLHAPDPPPVTMAISPFSAVGRKGDDTVWAMVVTRSDCEMIDDSVRQLSTQPQRREMLVLAGGTYIFHLL